MGPRSCKRGNRITMEGSSRAHLASMGPRSCKRGNKLPYCAIGLHGAASMGPRSCKRGNADLDKAVADSLASSFNGAALLQARK